MSENNVEPTVPIEPISPTNIEIIPVYDVNNPKPSWNNPKPSWIEETQTEDILPDMNRFYGIPMGIEQEILNNQSQFNKQIKERFNKALI